MGSECVHRHVMLADGEPLRGTCLDCDKVMSGDDLADALQYQLDHYDEWADDA